MGMENYESVLADLQTRRDQIDSAIEAIKLIMGAGAELSNGAGSGTQRAIAPQNVPAGAFHRLSLVDATKKYLDMVKTKQGTMQILKALEQGGLPLTKYTTLYAVLRRRQSQVGDIVKIGDEWSLTEWHPNNPNIKKLIESAGAPKKTKKKKKKAKRGKRVVAEPTGEADSPGKALHDGGPDEMTLGDAAEKVLRAEGKPMHVKAIMTAVAEFGKNPGKDTVAKNLMRDKRFVRTDPNTFDLAERVTVPIEAAATG